MKLHNWSALAFAELQISLGSVYQKTELSDILKYRYRYRRQYSQYRKIPNTDDNIPNRFTIFGICLHAVLRHFILINTW